MIKEWQQNIQTWLEEYNLNQMKLKLHITYFELKLISRFKINFLFQVQYISDSTFYKYLDLVIHVQL